MPEGVLRLRAEPSAIASHFPHAPDRARLHWNKGDHENRPGYHQVDQTGRDVIALAAGISDGPKSCCSTRRFP